MIDKAIILLFITPGASEIFSINLSTSGLASAN